MDIPNAGEPVCGQPKNTDEQHQNSRSVLDVVIQFTGNSTQTQQTDHFKGAEKTADPLKKDRNKKTTLDYKSSVDH